MKNEIGDMLEDLKRDIAQILYVYRYIIDQGKT